MALFGRSKTDSNAVSTDNAAPDVVEPIVVEPIVVAPSDSQNPLPPTPDPTDWSSIEETPVDQHQVVEHQVVEHQVQSVPVQPPLHEIPLPPPNPPRKKLPVLPLALGFFGLSAAALAAYYFLTPKQTEDTNAIVPMARTRPAPPSRPRAAPTSTKRKVVANPRVAPVKPGVKVVKRVTASPTPVAPVRAAQRGRAGAAGIVPEGARNTGAPSIVPPKPGGMPSMVPAQGVPTPIQPPDGMAGQAGRSGDRGEVMIVRRVAAPVPLTPVLQAQLDRLWQAGAQAKRRRDYAAARRAWQQMLQLRPNHPGIQDAIDKLPEG